MTAIAEALADVASVGPYFVVDVDPDVGADPLWRPLSELHGRALPDQIAGVRVRLGTPEERVAASIWFQGVAGCLWSPVLASAAIHGVVPDLDPGRTFWRAISPSTVRLAVPGNGGRPADPAQVHRTVVQSNLRPLVAAVQSVTKIAEGLLWGNAASALVGTFGVLAEARPDHEASARSYVRELLAMPPLHGRGTFGPGGFRRRSCCLYYRAPGGTLCGDCALARK